MVTTTSWAAASWVVVTLAVTTSLVIDTSKAVAMTLDIATASKATHGGGASMIVPMVNAPTSIEPVQAVDLSCSTDSIIKVAVMLSETTLITMLAIVLMVMVSTATVEQAPKLQWATASQEVLA